jgi:hypothetical protein
MSSSDFPASVARLIASVSSSFANVFTPAAARRLWSLPGGSWPRSRGQHDASRRLKSAVGCPISNRMGRRSRRVLAVGLWPFFGDLIASVRGSRSQDSRRVRGWWQVRECVGQTIGIGFRTRCLEQQRRRPRRRGSAGTARSGRSMTSRQGRRGPRARRASGFRRRARAGSAHSPSRSTSVRDRTI